MSPNDMYYLDGGEKIACLFPTCSRTTNSVCGFCHYHWFMLPRPIQQKLIDAFVLSEKLDCDQDAVVDQLWNEVCEWCKQFVQNHEEQRT